MRHRFEMPSDIYKWSLQDRAVLVLSESECKNNMMFAHQLGPQMLWSGIVHFRRIHGLWQCTTCTGPGTGISTSFVTSTSLASAACGRFAVGPISHLARAHNGLRQWGLWLTSLSKRVCIFIAPLGALVGMLLQVDTPMINEHETYCHDSGQTSDFW